MAQHGEDALRRTDATEARFQETVPDDQKFPPSVDALKSVPRGGQDDGIKIDKPVSVTDTGYGGVSGRGNDIEVAVHDTTPGPALDHKSGESITEKAKDVATGVKDLATGKKQEEAAVPVVDQSGHPAHHGHGGKVGEKVRDCVTGQKPGHGAAASEGLEEWPSRPEAPSATYTDDSGRPVEGPRDDKVKKEGVMAKVVDKLHH